MVFIQVEQTLQGGEPGSDFNNPFDLFGDEFFERFFGQRFPHQQREHPEHRQYRQQGQGSGFIISKDDVQPDRPADEAGLRPGTLIREVNRQAVHDTEELIRHSLFDPAFGIARACTPPFTTCNLTAKAPCSWCCLTGLSVGTTVKVPENEGDAYAAGNRPFHVEGL